MRDKKNLIIAFFCLFLTAVIIINPQKYSTSCLNGFLLFAKNVLPTLFPFFFLTKLIAETGAINSLSSKTSKITQKLFRTSGSSSYIFLMSILSGYPVGAKLTQDFYENKLIDKNEAFKICTFTSTSGPLFVIGTVGCALLKNYKAAIIIFVSHILGAILNGIVHRNYKDKTTNQLSPFSLKTPNKNMLSDCMYNAVLSILLVGGFIAFFSIVIDVVLSLKIFSNVPLKILTSGTIEVTRGCFELSASTLSEKIKVTLACGFISFGGLSIHAQAFAFLSKCEIPYFKFFVQKLIHTLFSSLICFLLSLFLL